MSEYRTKIGHAHLKVRDLDRSIDFYARFVGLRLVERVDDAYAFLTAGTYHHELALQNVGPNAPVPPAGGTGLYHVAFEVPSREDFARAYKQLTDAGIEVATVDHLISWAMYCDDPDGNGLEIYWDARHEAGRPQLWRGQNVPLERDEILRQLEPVPPAD